MMSFEALNPVYIVTAWRPEPVPAGTTQGERVW
jgi:hypothetical protein